MNLFIIPLKMLKYLLYTTGVFFALQVTIAGQNTSVLKDTLQNNSLNEVIIIHSKNKKLTAPKSLGSVDEYLANKEGIALIRRGAYAWEPMLNNMAIERTRQTIDGMQVFHACTDKMDPITSYVEINNLESADVTSGSQGSLFGATLGGSINLKTKKLLFTEKDSFKGKIRTGYETVSKHKIIGGDLNFTSNKLSINGSILHRDADNYRAGGHSEIKNSQFSKLNASGNIGFKFNPRNTLEAAAIYDKATDVGYPALPMDVSLAEALITSLTHIYTPDNPWITKWETKLYYNAITHRMDDKNRAEVFIRMDMPGWTNTYGVYSAVSATIAEKHHIHAVANAFYNKSLAEMTMFSNQPQRSDMFAYTWPDVKTAYGGITFKDHWQISDDQSLLITAGIGTNKNHVSREGINQLSIFLNDDTFKANKTRLTGNLAVNFEKTDNTWLYGAGIGYGNRAPSVSEGYGYYLFNSGDQYDYIGNPNLNNESTYEGNVFVKYLTPAFSSKLSGSFFYLSNYIIGVITPPFNAMTHGGKGVKIYNNISYAVQASADWNFTYKITHQWMLTGGLSCSYGKDKDDNTLPFIAPFVYKAAINFNWKNLKTQLSLRGNTVKNDVAKVYGETRTPAFAVLDWSANYDSYAVNNVLNTSIGIENILDTAYTTYSDWNHIPNPGRNFYIHLTYSF